jgi:hypothetical protein
MSRPYPKIASVQQNAGESWPDAVVRNLSYGFNGAVCYLPPSTPTAWTSDLAALAAQIGTEAFHLQLTAKTHSDTGLAEVLTKLPTAWRAGFTYNVYQEPEDNLTTSAQQTAYRSWYTSAAKVIREETSWKPKLPWVEWQEWTLDPANTNGWNLANFTPPSTDFGGVLWSLFEYGEKDRLNAQIERILNAMGKYAPGKPWGLMASCYTLHPYGASSYTAAQYQEQSDWLEQCFYETKGAGAKCFAWYDVNFPTGGAAGEGRLEKNPVAGPLLKSLA